MSIENVFQQVHPAEHFRTVLSTMVFIAFLRFFNLIKARCRPAHIPVIASQRSSTGQKTRSLAAAGRIQIARQTIAW